MTEPSPKPPKDDDRHPASWSFNRRSLELQPVSDEALAAQRAKVDAIMDAIFGPSSSDNEDAELGVELDDRVMASMVTQRLRTIFVIALTAARQDSAAESRNRLPCGHVAANIGDTGACEACNDMAAKYEQGRAEMREVAEAAREVVRQANLFWEGDGNPADFELATDQLAVSLRAISTHTEQGDTPETGKTMQERFNDGDMPTPTPTNDQEQSRVLSIDQIKAIARQRHAMTGYAGQKYEHHLQQVENILVEFGHTNYVWRAAAWLHDAIEDTGTTRGEVEKWCGRKVANLVWAVTGIGPNRKARNQSIYDKLALFPAACVLKIADRIANVEQTYLDGRADLGRMYLNEADEFGRVVEAHVPLEMCQRLNAALDRMRQ